MHKCPYCEQEIDIGTLLLPRRWLVLLRRCPHCKLYLWLRKQAGGEVAVEAMDIMYKHECF